MDDILAQRSAIALQCAKYICFDRVKSFAFAKQKATKYLPLKSFNPSNHEILEQIKLLQDHGDATYCNKLKVRVKAVLKIMSLLKNHDPKLFGLLTYNVFLEHDSNELHVFSDNEVEVLNLLISNGLKSRNIEKRYRFHAGDQAIMYGYEFEYHGSDYQIMLFERRQVSRVPICPILQKRMKR
jgi:hypothetical protein